jgi:predicted  nucleic acid-binding Zn-ribbon protein
MASFSKWGGSTACSSCPQVLDLLNKLEKNRTKSSSNGKIQDLDARTIAAWFKKYNEIIPRRAENIKSALKVQALQMEVALYRESLEKKTSESCRWEEKSIEYQIERDEEAQKAAELETRNKALKALESERDGLRQRVQSLEQAGEPGGVNSLIVERDGLKMSVTALMEEGKALWVAHDTLKSKLEGQQQTTKGGQQSSESIQLQDPTNRVRKPQTQISLVQNYLQDGQQAHSENPSDGDSGVRAPQTQVTTLYRNIANDQPSMAELEDKCKDLGSRNQELNSQNQQLNIEASFAQDEISALQDSMTKITDERDDLKNQLRSLQGEISGLSGNLLNGQESLAAVENDRDIFRDKAQLLNAQVSRLQEDVHNGLLAFTSLEQERDQLRSQISKSENDLADGNQAMAALGVECNTLKQTITGLNERIVKLEREKEIVQQQFDKACEEGRQVLYERNIEIDHRTNKLESYGRRLESEIAQLKREATAENLDKLRREIGELASRKKKLEKERDDTSKALEAYKIREEVIAQKEKELRLAKNQADILKQKLEQVGGYQNKAKEAERVAATLHQENKDLQKEVNDMRRKTQSPTPQIKGNGQKLPPSMLSRPDERYRRLQDQVAQLQSENETLQKKVQKLDQASSRDDDGDEDMNGEGGARGKRAGDSQHRPKLAPKTRAPKKDLVADRLGEVEDLIKKWKA